MLMTELVKVKQYVKYVLHRDNMLIRHMFTKKLLRICGKIVEQIITITNKHLNTNLSTKKLYY